MDRYIKDIFTGEYRWVKDKPVVREPRPTRQSAGPMVMPDIKEYRSLVTGEMVTSRSHHREYLKRNDLIEVGNEKLSPNTPPPLPDPRETMYEAAQMLDQGYRPKPIENIKDWEE